MPGRLSICLLQTIVSLYDKPVWALIIEFADEELSMEGRTFSPQEATTWFKSRYPDVKKATINAHIRMMSTNVQSRLHWSPREHHNVFYSVGRGTYRRSNSVQDPPPIMTSDDVSESASSSETSHRDRFQTEEEEQISQIGGSEFAYERDLQNFLIRHLELVEPGLKLYRDEGITGEEYPVGRRRIDILAVDSQGSLVVIELKVSKGHDRVIGQILRYLGSIKADLAEEGQKVRGIIIAKDITDDLRLACSMTQNISLREYSISFALDDVK
mgnify:CR=1 FL=1